MQNNAPPSRFEPPPVRADISWRSVLAFCACLAPISVDGFGINYLFLLFPIYSILVRGRVNKPVALIYLYLYGCFFVFIFATVYQINWLEYFDRRLVSLFLFLAIFSLCFIRLEIVDICSFKLAIVVASTIYSLVTLLEFVLLGGATLNFEAKDLVGSQRYGFLLILAYWIIHYDTTLINSGLIRSIIKISLIFGMMITFSRATIVAFGASIVFSVIHGSKSKFQIKKTIYKFFATIIFLVVTLIIISELAPVVFDFFYARLIERIASGAISDALVDSETSEGTRIFIWSKIIEFVLDNPLTGSGYLGPWVLNLYGDLSGSSHNQYLDVLFRVGPILFLGYIYFIFRMANYLRISNKALFIGFLGMLVYGIFHETFKEPQGAFVFAMFIAMTFQKSRLSI